MKIDLTEKPEVRVPSFLCAEIVHPYNLIMLSLALAILNRLISNHKVDKRFSYSSQRCICGRIRFGILYVHVSCAFQVS